MTALLTGVVCLERLFTIRDEAPIGHQLFLMQFSPCQDKLYLFARKVPLDDFACVYVDGRLVLVIICMEMRRRVFARAKVHLNDDPEKHGNVGIVRSLPSLAILEF